MESEYSSTSSSSSPRRKDSDPPSQGVAADVVAQGTLREGAEPDLEAVTADAQGRGQGVSSSCSPEEVSLGSQFPFGAASEVVVRRQEDPQSAPPKGSERASDEAREPESLGPQHDESMVEETQKQRRPREAAERPAGRARYLEDAEKRGSGRRVEETSAEALGASSGFAKEARQPPARREPLQARTAPERSESSEAPTSPTSEVEAPRESQATRKERREGKVRQQNDAAPPGNAGAAEPSAAPPLIFIGRIRRWCRDRPGQAWGFVSSEFHSCDILLQGNGKDELREGDIIAFECQKSESSFLGSNARVISAEEQSSLRIQLLDKVVPIVARPAKAIELNAPSRSAPSSAPGRRATAQPAPAPAAAERTAGGRQITNLPRQALQPPQQQMPQHPQLSQIQIQQQQQQPCGATAAAARQSQVPYPHPQQHQLPPGYPSFAYPADSAAGSYQAQQAQQAQAQAQGSPQAAQRPQPQTHVTTKLLLEPPPMLENFNAKVVARALQTGQWQGPRALKSPRFWECKQGDIAARVGLEWVDLLNQAIASSEEHELQAQNAAAAAWAGDSAHWGMWNASGQAGLNGDYAMSPMAADPNHNMMMGMHGGDPAMYGAVQGISLGSHRHHP